MCGFFALFIYLYVKKLPSMRYLHAAEAEPTEQPEPNAKTIEVESLEYALCCVTSRVESRLKFVSPARVWSSDLLPPEPWLKLTAVST